jgi:hypothetical protein
MSIRLKVGTTGPMINKGGREDENVRKMLGTLVMNVLLPFYLPPFFAKKNISSKRPRLQK